MIGARRDRDRFELRYDSDARHYQDNFAYYLRALRLDEARRQETTRTGDEHRRLYRLVQRAASYLGRQCAAPGSSSGIRDGRWNAVRHFPVGVWRQVRGQGP